MKARAATRLHALGAPRHADRRRDPDRHRRAEHAGVPAQQRIIAAANQLVTGTLTARAEAVKRQVPVTFVPERQPDGRHADVRAQRRQGLGDAGLHRVGGRERQHGRQRRTDLTDATDGNGVVDAGEQILMRSARARASSIGLGELRLHVRYGPSGFTRADRGRCAPAPRRRAAVRRPRPARRAPDRLSSARVVRIDRPGRGQVLQELRDVTTPTIAGTLGGVGPTCP